ncbi:MAG: hypothetical protein IJT66_03880 [Clostridia bacterium]|nr:hypothetical protein [Clostridia bacterium]
MEPLFLGIDIGTGGTKAVLSDANGTLLAEAFCASTLYRPDRETVYEEPEEIFRSVMTAIQKCVQLSGTPKERIAAIGMDSQMAGIMGIDEHFGAVTPLDSWLDTRCAPYTEKIRLGAGDEAIRSSGGQMIHSHASKILWWKHEQPATYRKIKKFVQPNAYVAGRLCGLSAADAFMDYTFLHFNCFSDNLALGFNPSLLREFGVEEEKMPRIVSPQTVVGTVLPTFATACGLPDGVRVIAGCGDTAASSLGAGVTRKGLAYDVAGTASVFACCTDQFKPDVQNKTLLFSRSVCDGLYLPLSYISGGGLCLSWFSKLAKKDLKTLDSLAAQKTPGADGVTFIPHFSGRTFPLDDRINGAFLGLTQHADDGVLFRAILESIAYEYKSYLSILKQSGALTALTTVIGVGGGAKSSVFSQIKADVLGTDYHTLAFADTAPAAMALLAAKATGFTDKSFDELFAPQTKTVCTADEAKTAVYTPLATQYRSLLNRFGDFLKGTGE